jgi:hypothetical protein
MSDYYYDDGYSSTDYSYDLADASSSAYTASLDLYEAGDEAWYAGNTELAGEYYSASYEYDGYSDQLYAESWDAWYASDDAGYYDTGYSSYESAAGYSTTDSSLIEPASAADDYSLIA